MPWPLYSGSNRQAGSFASVLSFGGEQIPITNGLCQPCSHDPSTGCVQPEMVDGPLSVTQGSPHNEDEHGMLSLPMQLVQMMVSATRWNFDICTSIWKIHRPSTKTSINFVSV